MKTKLNNTILKATLIILFVSSINSCKKHTCECVSMQQTYNPGTGPTTKTMQFKGRKSKAKTQCESLSSSADIYGNETKCTFK